MMIILQAWTSYHHNFLMIMFWTDLMIMIWILHEFNSIRLCFKFIVQLIVKCQYCIRLMFIFQKHTRFYDKIFIIFYQFLNIMRMVFILTFYLNILIDLIYLVNHSYYSFYHYYYFDLNFPHPHRFFYTKTTKFSYKLLSQLFDPLYQIKKET